MSLLDRAKKRAGSLLGDANAREVHKLQGAVAAVADWEPEFARLSNDELAAKTPEFIERLEDGASLDDILPEAFAVVREAARRQVQMRHYDVQIVGGIVLHQGKVAEMRTGEGKTLVATLAALPQRAGRARASTSITVNDYLARARRPVDGRRSTTSSVCPSACSSTALPSCSIPRPIRRSISRTPTR